MNANSATKPRMMPIKNLAKNGPVGGLKRCCTTAEDRLRAFTATPRIKPTSPRCRSAGQPNLGRGSTYRRGDSVQTIGTSSDCAIGKTAGRLFGPEPEMKQGVINEPAFRSSRRSVEKDGGRRLTHPRLPAAIRDCRQAVRWCRGSCQSMPLQPRPRPRHHLANRPARRLHVSLGGFGMCNGSCADYTTYARLCRPGAGQIADK